MIEYMHEHPEMALWVYVAGGVVGVVLLTAILIFIIKSGVLAALKAYARYSASANNR